jgi:hypothetical protein
MGSQLCTVAADLPFQCLCLGPFLEVSFLLAHGLSENRCALFRIMR